MAEDDDALRARIARLESELAEARVLTAGRTDEGARSDGRLARAVAVADVGFYDWDVQRDVVVFSDHMKAQWGFTGSESLADTAALIHPDDRAATLGMVKTAMEGHGPYLAEYRVVRPDGRVVWIEARGQVTYDERGQPARFFGTSVDITRRKQAELALRESEARLRAAQEQLTLTLESARMGTYAYDLAAGRMQLSDGAAELLGVPRESSATDIIDSVLHPDDRPRIAEVWQRAVTDLRPYQVEYRIQRADRSTRWIQSRSSIQTGDDGAPTHLVGVLGDVTDKKQSEAALLAERHTLESIFQASPAAMVLWRGPELVFDKVNAEYQKIFGERALLGRPLLEAVPELADQEFPALLRRVLETGETHSGTEVLARLASRPAGPLEDHYYDYSYVRLTDPAGQPLGVYDHAVDVTERVLARRGMEKTQDALRRTVSELEHERVLRERFVAALSHDLRSPLGVVRLCVERLQRLKGIDESAQVLAARMLKNIERIDQMIEDQLDAQSLGAGGRLTLHREVCDLREVAAAALKDLGAVHGDRFVLRATGELTGQLDCKYVRRVIENLCTNAVKYGAQRPVTVTLERDGGDAVLAVHDHGAPIPASEQAHLFEAFRRAPSARASSALGWGLGLLLVRGAVESHGGTVGVKSSPEEGTTFTARLPLAASAGAPT